MGSWLTPPVHPCPVRWGGCGWPKWFTSPMNHRNTRNSNMVAEQEFRTTTQTQTSQPTSSAQCVPLECADVPDECNAEQSNDPQSSQQHDEPDDWDPDAKLKLKVGDVTVTVKQRTDRQADNSRWIAWTRTTRPSDMKPCLTSSGQPHDEEEERQGCQERWCGEQPVKTVETRPEAYQCQVSDDCVGNLCGSRVICLTLSSSTQATIEIHSLLDSIDFSLSLSKARFEELNMT